MVTTIKNAAPQANLLGIQDLSGRVLTPEAEALPVHLPHAFIFGAEGPLTPQLVVGDSLIQMYGSETFDYRSKYANHQTVLVNEVNAQGNAIMVQRLKPEDAPAPASITFGLDLLRVTDFPVYERNVDGSYKLDANKQPIPTGEVTTGFYGRWVVGALENGALGQDVKREGSMTNAQGEQSTFYPMHELEVSSFGSLGNLKGVRLYAPTTASSIPVDDDIIVDQSAYLYRIQFLARPDAASVPNVITNNYGDQYVDFSYKEGTVNTRVDTELFADEVILQQYQELDNVGYAPKFGPFGRMHVYYDNIQEVLDTVYAEESKYGLLPAGEGAEHIINLMGAVNYDGNPYYAYAIKGPSEGGVLLSESTTHYCTGGGDGTMTFESFDKLVRNQVANYGSLDGLDFLDDAVYPQSCIYDTGFTIDTKKALLGVIGKRKDMYVVLSTQDVSGRQNTAAEESSMAVALRTAARMYPESEVYGTSVCRAIVIGHSGYLLNSKYKGLLPLTIEFASKTAKWLGASNGIWKTGQGFDLPPANQVTMFKNVNCTFKSATVRNRDWSNGLVWVQSYDRRSLFFPAVQTVFDDDTSVLNAAPNMFVAVELEKVAQRVWRDLTGISSLTPEQFIERSNRLIEEKTVNRFDNRVTVVAETYYTDFDEVRGYSWSCKIHMYANNMKTVGTFTIASHRAEDLEA